ncbi:MAG TPA: T9SS type A sorting domain-containing protein [Candidatus Kapabacteria bacterium]|nr:T9SS type A sorting domain-containing protein [Candidatus Kapabacteria bacterium]
MKKFYLIILITLLCCNFAFADNGGRATRTSTLSSGCGSCHGAQKNLSTMVSFLSGQTTVEPGSTNNYSIRVYSSSNVSSGINIGVKTSITGDADAGILSPGTGTKAMLSELVHSSPKMAQSGNADFDFTWKAPNNPGKYFMRAVATACNDDGKVSGDTWNWMPVQEIIVRGVELVSPIGGENFCENNTMQIKWNAAGIDKINIDLSFDGGVSYSYNVAQNLTSLGGSYVWSIPNGIQQSSNCKIKISVVGEPNKFSVSKNAFGIYGLFTITSHPISKELCEGESYTMKISAVGTGLKYQWRKNGSPIMNANGTEYTIKQAKPGDEAVYGCVVSSPCQGNVSSNEATIKVRALVKVKIQPRDVITCLGGHVAFDTQAEGQDLKYQWYKNNGAIVGATTYKLEILEASDNDAGKYWCKITGFCPPAKTTDTVTLTINKPVSITKQPVNMEVCEKNQATFSIEVSGEQVNYQWFFNNSLMSVPNQATLVLNNVNQANIGSYYCLVSNPCGQAVKSDIAELSINLLPKIKSLSPDQTKLVGENIDIVLSTEGTITSVQWYFEGKLIKDADSTVLSLKDLQKSNSGNYYCILKNNCGEIKSPNIKLTVVDVMPGPRLTLATDIIDFRNVFVAGMLDSNFSQIILNSGDEDLVINDIDISNNQNQEFSLLTTVPITIKPKESIDLRIVFTPNSLGDKEITLNFNSNSITSTVLTVKGKSCNFKIINDAVINFGSSDIEKEAKVIKSMVYNNSNYDATLTNVEYTCPIDNPFTLKTSLPAIIASMDSLELEFVFTPYSTSNYLCNATLIFTNPDTSSTITLIGEGITDVYEGFGNLSVFPNPASDKLIIENLEAGINIITIYNQLGNEVFRNNINSNQLVLNLSDDNSKLSLAGVYFVKIENGTKLKVFKIVKI